MNDNSQRIFFYTDRLKENILYLNDFFSARNMSWTFVIKAFFNYPDSFINELSYMPMGSLATDNLTQLKKIKELNPEMELWFLNYEGIEVIDDVVDVNLTHSTHSTNNKTCLMLALDPERMGAELNIDMAFKRLGAYLDCANMPDASFFEEWQKFHIPTTIIQSLGTSVSFEHIDYLQSKGVNHYRIGELALTGKSLINGKKIKGLRPDVFGDGVNVNYEFISNFINDIYVRS